MGIKAIQLVEELLFQKSSWGDEQTVVKNSIIL